MNPLKPDRMANEERLAEIALILARGMLRLRTKSSVISARCGESPLDNSFEQSGHAPVANRRRPR